MHPEHDGEDGTGPNRSHHVLEAPDLLPQNVCHDLAPKRQVNSPKNALDSLSQIKPDFFFIYITGN